MIIEKIEQKAKEVLRAAGINEVPVSVEAVASKNGFVIKRGASKKFSGILIRKDEHGLIGINSSEAETRQRFTIAHELGHFFLHPQKNAFVDYRESTTAIKRPPKEQQADMFAAALLMPSEALEKDFRANAKQGIDEATIQALANKYQVSGQAMKIRLLNLNLRD